MAKTEFVLIRLTPTDQARLKRVAEAEYLGVSTWARQAILRAIEAAEHRTESDSAPPPPSSKPKRPRKGRT